MINPFQVESNTASEREDEEEALRLAVLTVAMEIAKLSIVIQRRREEKIKLLYRGKTAEEWMDIKINNDRKKEKAS